MLKRKNGLETPLIQQTININEFFPPPIRIRQMKLDVLLVVSVLPHTPKKVQIFVVVLGSESIMLRIVWEILNRFVTDNKKQNLFLERKKTFEEV